MRSKDRFNWGKSEEAKEILKDAARINSGKMGTQKPC